MGKIKLDIDEGLLHRLKTIANAHEQTINKLFVEIATRYADDYDEVMEEVNKVSDEEIEFLFNDHPAYMPQDPNHRAKIIPLFRH